MDTTSKLPKGVWYNPQKGHYRVRLYEGKKVIHYSCHRRLEDALAVWSAVTGKSISDTEEPIAPLLRGLL